MDWLKKRKSPDCVSFLTTFVIGFATHLFGFVNVIHNYDDIAVLPAGSGTGITLGRWLLTVLDKLFEKAGLLYNLPYVNALVFLFLIALSVRYIIRILEIKNHTFAILIGAVFAAFPSVTSTLFFKYTAVFYGISILCAVTAVWWVKEYRYGFLPATLLIACSLGIYQAFVPMTIGLMVISLLREVLTQNTEAKAVLKRGLKYAAALAAGVGAYFVLLKMALYLLGAQLSTYKGVDQMGAIKLTELPGLVGRAFEDFFRIFAADYAGVSQTPLIRLGILALSCLSVGLILFLLMKQHKKWDAVVLTALLCIALPLAVNFIAIMSPNGYIYTLMVYAFALIYAVPFVLLDLIEPMQLSGKIFPVLRNILKKAAVVAALAVFFSYAYLANLNYTQLYHTTQKTKDYLSSFIVQVRMTDGFDASMKWALIGDEFQDPLFDDNWESAPRFGGNVTAPWLINAYSRVFWIRNYTGYNIPFADEQQLAALEKDARVMNMPCFPNDGSIRVIDDIVVIKLENKQP